MIDQWERKSEFISKLSITVGLRISRNSFWIRFSSDLNDL